MLEQRVPFDSSLYFSRTEIDPEISKVLLATNCLLEEFCPLLWASLTLAWSVTVCLSGITMFYAPIWVYDPADSDVSLANDPDLSY